MADSDRLRPYVPGFVVEWLRESPAVRHRTVDGSLAFVDVSGFTRLTERLAARGKVGAEEMSDLLDRTFAALLEVAYAHGAWLVKWGGDAVLLLFQDDGHASRACTAAAEMRRTMDVVGRLDTSCGPVRLRISTGVHSDRFDVFLVGEAHRELVLTGPGATTTAGTEAAADAGQVAVSPTTAALLPAGLVRRRADGLLLLTRSPGSAPAPPRPGVAADGVDVASCLPAATRSHLLTGGDDAEHRLVAVAFVEFSGVDALLETQGPGAATVAVDHVLRACQNACLRHGVSFWETDISKDGGKVMLVAGAPASTGEEEDALLRVARDVVDAGGALSVRIGVNSGRVFFGQFGPPYRRTMSVKGDAVNLAARIMGKAAPGEVLAAAGVVEHARTPFGLESVPPFLVKGKTHPVTAYRVGAPRDSGGASTTGPALVGRERELARLSAEWRIASHGRLRVCDLVGDPGVGKSRVLQELARRLDVTVVRIGCDPYTAGTAFLPLRRALRGLLGLAPDDPADVAGRALLGLLGEEAPGLRPWAPLVATVLGADVPMTPAVRALDERFRVRRQQEAVADLLVHLLPDPTLILVDDAHLLDPSSAALLDRLQEQAGTAPWLLVRARRDEPTAPPADDLVRLDLGPLERTPALALVHAVTDDAPLAPHLVVELVQRSGGNPLFLVELAVAAAQGRAVDDLPGSVEGVVAARIDRLQPADRRLLRAAAVVGLEVDAGVLEAVVDRSGDTVQPDALRRLSAFLDRTGPRSYRFRQALVRETAYEGLPYSRRAVLHGHAGDVLAERGGPTDDLAPVLSLHFLRAQRYEQAWEQARTAASRAHAAMAHAEAAELYERALDAARSAPVAGEEAALTWEALGDVRYRLGEFSRAAQAYAEARRRVSDRVVDAARLHHKSALCAERTGSYRQALRLLTTGARLVGPQPAAGPEQRLVAELAVARATVRHWQGRHADAARASRHAAELARGAGAQDVLAEALVWLDVSRLMRGEGDGAEAREALSLLERVGDRPWLLGRCHNELGIRAYYAGDWDTALLCYQRCRASFTRAGDAWAALMAQANEAELLCDQGRLTEAEPLLLDALRGGRASAAPGFVAFVTALLGRLDAKAGRSDLALTRLRSARSQYDAVGEPDEIAETDARIAEALVLGGDPAAALAAVRAVPTAMTPLLLRVRGQALQGLDRLDEAEVALRTAIEQARGASALHELALGLHALCVLHEVEGRPVPKDAVDECATLLQQLGITAVASPAQTADTAPQQQPAPGPGARTH